MKCAKCSTELERLVVKKIEIDRCPACGGIWFDRKELDEILQLDLKTSGLLHELTTQEASAAHDDDDRLGRCPRCAGGYALERKESLSVDGLSLDTCPGCHGVWLDRGELDAMAADPDAGAISGFFKDSY